MFFPCYRPNVLLKFQFQMTWRPRWKTNASKSNCTILPAEPFWDPSPNWLWPSPTTKVNFNSKSIRTCALINFFFYFNFRFQCGDGPSGGNDFRQCGFDGCASQRLDQSDQRCNYDQILILFYKVIWSNYPFIDRQWTWTVAILKTPQLQTTWCTFWHSDGRFDFNLISSNYELINCNLFFLISFFLRWFHRLEFGADGYRSLFR